MKSKMKGRQVMPLNRIPVKTGGELYRRVVHVQSSAWGPGDDFVGPLTELHIVMEVRGVDLPVILVLNPGELDRFVASLRLVRNAAWPHIPEGGVD